MAQNMTKEQNNKKNYDGGKSKAQTSHRMDLWNQANIFN